MDFASPGPGARRAGPPLTHEMQLRCVDRFDAVMAEWQLLADARPEATVFVGPSFTTALWEVFGAGAKRRLVVVRRDDAVRGVIPLALTIERRGVLRYRQLGFLRNRHTLRNLALVEDGDLVPTLRLMAAEAETIFFENVPVDFGRRVLRSALEAGLIDAGLQQGRNHCRIDLAQGWRAYLATRSGNFRWQLKKRARQAAELGTVDIRQITDRAELKEALPVMFALEARAWQGSDAGAAMDDADRDFHARLVDVLPERELGELWLLSIGGRTAAALRLLRRHDVLYVHAMYYDPELARVSPGTLLFARALESAADRGIAAVDCHGDTQFFRRWATGAKSHVTLRFFRPSAYGRLLNGARHIARSLRRRPDEAEQAETTARGLS